MRLRMVGWSDSPKKHTGFSTVAREYYQGFYEAGFDLSVFGVHDPWPDAEGTMPYQFYPASALDLMGAQLFVTILRKVKPEVVWILCDPGTLSIYLNYYLEGAVDWKRGGANFRPPIVAHLPIEGRPLPPTFGEVFSSIQEFGGTIVTYSPGSSQAVRQYFPRITPSYVHHGSDHIRDAYVLTAAERHLVREAVGIGPEIFFIGNVGVNKRTKGFPEIIQTAVELKASGQHKDILFYLHTEPENKVLTMQITPGHPLAYLSEFYGVDDMVLFKPDTYKNRGGIFDGTPRTNNTLARLLAGELTRPETATGRGYLFGNLDFWTRMQLFDLYLDLSHVEGWGLPLFEAMAFGVPCVTIKDGGVREEIHGAGCYQLKPIDHRLWDTWHTGAKLPRIDPRDAAQAIVTIKNDPVLRDELSERGRATAAVYSWQTSRSKMTAIVQEIRDRALDIDVEETHVLQEVKV